ETAEDYLCRGYVTVLFGSGQSLDDLDKAIAMRDTPIAHAIRGSVRGAMAFDRSDSALFELALDDMRQAKLRLSDNKFVRFLSIHTQMRAADRYGETDQAEKRKAALEEAGRDARELEGSPGLGYVMSRVVYLECVGDNEAALAELERASRHPEKHNVVEQYA